MRLATSFVTVCATSLALFTPIAAAEDSSSASGTSVDETATAPEKPAGDTSAKPSSGGASSDNGSSLNVGRIDTSELSDECTAQVEQAQEDHEKAVADGTAGSSFMGPQELAFGVLNGYGSSGMPAEPECIEDEKEAQIQKEWDEMPEWVQSARPTEATKEAGEWIATIATILGVAVNAAVVAARFSPEFRNSLAAFLRAQGFYWDNSKNKAAQPKK